ncbi:MAG: phosphatidylcholine/phosphatidylserine synthase [Planctomycetia bacterium]|nr:phosphatidylcholine/phosphatidylserine synthase [Planctomycetia bacterium]
MNHDRKLKQLLPNSVTMLGLAFGVSSLNMAFWGQWKYAFFFILLAAVFDFLDGKVARLLGVTSRFGMELDSLSDIISFGVSPGFLMYQWTMDPQVKIKVMEEVSKRSEAIGIGWGIVLFMVMCCALRLARFNTTSDQERPDYWKYFFVGVPAPAGAAITMFPLMLWLATHGQYECFRNPLFVRIFLVFSGIMMASKLPTICFKHLRFSDKTVSILRVVILALIAGTFCFPLWVLSFVCFVYIITIPIGIFYFVKFRRAYELAAPANDSSKDPVNHFSENEEEQSGIHSEEI